MEIKKVNLDRQNLVSNYIEQKQNFKHVLNSAKMTKMPTWKSPWFYGAVGLSSVAIVAIAYTSNQINNKLNDKTATLNTVNTPTVTTNVSEKRHYSNEKLNDAQPTISDQKALEKKESSNSQLTPVAETNSMSNQNASTEEAVGYNQIETAPQITKTSVKRIIGQPTVNGIANGVISVDLLKKSNLIESNSSVEITSYEVQYFNGNQDVVAQIRSNAIPPDLKDQIIAYNIGEMIFITGIKGLDENGRIVKLPSINLKLSK